jgi:hypothetical protein
MARTNVERAERLDSLQWTKDELAVLVKENEEIAKVTGYYESLVPKYREAAQRPWLPIAPDPLLP